MSKIHLTHGPRRPKYIPPGAEALNTLIESMGLYVRFQKQANSEKMSVMVHAEGAACTPFRLGELSVCLEMSQEKIKERLYQKFPISTAAYRTAPKSEDRHE